MTSITTSVLETPTRRTLERTCDDFAMFVLAAVAVVAGLTFRDYGLGWDDYTHAEYADLLLRMYGSGFRDTAALSFANLYMYGGGFDMVAALLHKILPLELFETRRLVGAIVGLIGLAVTWRVARRIGGAVAGVAALLLLALCPIFYGHMFMNPKDAPFAVAMVVLLMGLVRLAEEYPYPSPRTVLIIGLGAGFAIGSRILGGMAVVYAVVGFMPLFVEEYRTQGAREAIRRFAHLIYVLIPGLILGYLIMGLIWPWSIIEPANPFRALTYFSHFFEKPWKEMFDGALVSVPDMPWSYLPTLFALQMPELMIGLFVAGVVTSLMSLSRPDMPARQKSILLMLTLAATLPILIAIVKRPALYNGIRHFVFVIPPMALLGGIAFLYLNCAGLDALLLDEFSLYDPPRKYLARPDEDVAAIYVWALVAQGRGAVGLGNVADILRGPRFRAADYYAQPSSSDGRAFLGALGFTPVPSFQPDLWWYQRPWNRLHQVIAPSLQLVETFSERGAADARY